MDTFGQKLKQAVDKRDLRLEDVAQATGLDIVHIEALVRDDHGALPEDDTVTEGLQAFARLVDVDPDEVINDYRREREDHRRTALTDVDVAVVRDWSQEARLSLSSLRPERMKDKGELQEITFRTSGTGPMSAVTGFLWRLESSPLPIRVMELQLGTRKEGTDDLSLQLRISALCQSAGQQTSSHAASDTTVNKEKNHD